MDYAGLENLAGIPGSLGGLVYMNGGSYGSEIFDHIVEVEILDENFELRNLKKEEIHFTYRKTEIQEKKWIVVNVTFKFEKGHNLEKVKECREKRKGNHPLDLPNLGSTFKNPEGYFSAKLIIEAGMQGVQLGGAQVSTKHPNFVVNHGNAKFSDVVNLVNDVKKAVKEKTGIELQEEIIIVK
jgi:UDP-N-acetylmuramate dehydrogenase